MRLTLLPPSRSVFVAFAAIGGLASACNDVLGIGEPIAATTAGGGSVTTSTATSSGGGGSSSGSTGGEGGGGTGGTGGAVTTTTTTTEPECAQRMTEIVTVKEDAAIFNGAGDCNGAINHGADPFANVGLGRGLFRFVLTDPIVDAFDEDRVLDLRLTLSRAPECGNGPPCNVKKPGAFEARPLRNEWTEGNGTSYSGADWCRRLAGNPGAPWGAPGADAAEDVAPGEPSGTTTIEDIDTLLVMPLDPAMHKPWIGPIGNQTRSLSVRISRTDGAAVFVCATREANLPGTAPQLTVTYCIE